MPPDRDQAYLWDMGQAAQEVSDLVLHLSAEEFRENRLTRLAVERLLIILGEAAMSVSEQYRLQHPEISWQQIQWRSSAEPGRPFAGPAAPVLR